MTLNTGIVVGAQKLANSLAKTSEKIITKIPILDVIGDVTGVASIAEHSVKFYPHCWRKRPLVPFTKRDLNYFINNIFD